MDSRKGQNTHGGGHEYPGRRSRDERRSLSESLADGTSKFFSSMVAKKNGIFNDLSSKIENKFATKTDSTNNSIDENSYTAVPATPATPPPRPPPPKRLPSLGSSREKENVMKRMASMPAYTRTNSKPDFVPDVPTNRDQRTNQKESSSDERFSVNGMNVSFDEPIYNKPEANSSQPVTDIPVSDEISTNNQDPTARQDSASYSSASQPRPLPRSQPPGKGTDKLPASSQSSAISVVSGAEQSKQIDDRGVQRKGEPYLSREIGDVERQHDNDNASHAHGARHQSLDSNMFAKERSQPRNSNGKATRHQSVDSNMFAKERKLPRNNGNRNPDNDMKLGSNNTSSTQPVDQPNKQKAPKFTTTKRRSSTVDEMLFDDYVEPEIDALVVTEDVPPENLICFEADSELDHVVNSSDSSPEGNGPKIAGASVDSSDVEFGGAQMQRSASVGSEKSWSSNYSVDSQPDDVTLECMEFMKSFVDKVFHNSEDISQTEKAKFGELCQYFPGRLWFSRYVNSQRVHNKKVTEAIYFRLMQYFAVCLFECNEAEDFSPAKTLMNMCFTFYYQVPSPQGQTEKVFLYMYMRDQTIWQSLRFWNAAYFDAVQCERSRRPMPTNSDETETVSDDKQFQENITFGQLGTFACNMRAFGLSKELCLEFLRKQSTIANLRKDQVKLLRDNIEKVKETK